MRQTLRLYLLILPFLIVIGGACIDVAYGQEAIVFGPQTFTRGTGKPRRVVKNFSVNLPLQDFTISVQNGEGRSGRVSSAIVELNGLPVVGPNDFNKQVDLITKPVSLQGQNSLAVELRSAPGTSIIVAIHDRLFQNQHLLGAAELPKHAQAIGLDVSRFQECLESGRQVAEIRKDLTDGQRVGVRGTPTFFLGIADSNSQTVTVSRVISGAQPYAQFKEAIEGALREIEK